MTDKDRADSFVRSASAAQVEVFVASCVERAAPLLFLALAPSPDRVRDRDAFLSLLDGLWSATHLTAGGRSAGRARSLQFPELHGEEEPLGTLLFASHAEAAMYYAYTFLETGDGEPAATCSHVVRNSAFYVDNRAEAGDRLYQQELAVLAADIAEVETAADPWGVAGHLRERSRNVGRLRMEAFASGLANSL